MPEQSSLDSFAELEHVARSCARSINPFALRIFSDQFPQAYFAVSEGDLKQEPIGKLLESVRVALKRAKRGIELSRRLPEQADRSFAMQTFKMVVNELAFLKAVVEPLVAAESTHVAGNLLIHGFDQCREACLSDLLRTSAIAGLAKDEMMPSSALPANWQAAADYIRRVGECSHADAAKVAEVRPETFRAGCWRSLKKLGFRPARGNKGCRPPASEERESS